MLDSFVVIDLLPISVASGYAGIVFFFFKQKTAYEMLRSLVGSEMCIRDSHIGAADLPSAAGLHDRDRLGAGAVGSAAPTRARTCLLYTSDAADDLLCVDLGGRRIIKKKTTTIHTQYPNKTSHAQEPALSLDP